MGIRTSYHMKSKSIFELFPYSNVFNCYKHLFVNGQK